MRQAAALPPLLLAPLLSVLLATGCSQPDVAPLRRAALEPGDPPPAAAAGTFGGEIVFCRRVGKKTGKRIAVGDRFVESDRKRDRFIHAFVDLHDVPAGMTHQVHLLWLGPNGKELFRKFARLTVTPDSSGYRAEVEWRDAEKLTWRRPEPPRYAGRPDVTLRTRLNVSPRRQRPEGKYTLKVYWNRELMLQRSFTFTRRAD